MASLKPLLFVGISVLISENSASGTCESLRIVGGHNISIEDVPYMVSVFSGCGPICGGSIIDEWFILTAAHCFVGFPDNNDTLRVLYGTEYLSQGGDFINVTQRLCHDGFNGTEEHSPHDICILKLQKPIPIGWSSRISRVQLPSEDFVLNEDAMLNVSGWGLTKSEFMRNDLRQTTVPVVGEECCTRAYPNITPLLDTYICAGTRGHDACEGDSGGPLTYNNVQVGIASAARGCGYYPGLYTRVTSYLDWIYMTITII